MFAEGFRNLRDFQNWFGEVGGSSVVLGDTDSSMVILSSVDTIVKEHLPLSLIWGDQGEKQLFLSQSRAMKPLPLLQVSSTQLLRPFICLAIGQQYLPSYRSAAHRSGGKRSLCANATSKLSCSLDFMVFLVYPLTSSTSHVVISGPETQIRHFWSPCSICLQLDLEGHCNLLPHRSWLVPI